MLTRHNKERGKLGIPGGKRYRASMVVAVVVVRISREKCTQAGSNRLFCLHLLGF